MLSIGLVEFLCVYDSVFTEHRLLVENISTMGLLNRVLEGNDPSSSEEKPILKSAHRKVDNRLLLWYAFVYLIMRIHVGNISNSAIINLEEGTGIKKQLGGLSSSQWAWALSIFYYPYMFFEPLATLALKKYSPSRWMSRIMVTWVMILETILSPLPSAYIETGYHFHVSGCNSELRRHIGLPILPWTCRSRILPRSSVSIQQAS